MVYRRIKAKIGALGVKDLGNSTCTNAGDSRL